MQSLGAPSISRLDPGPPALVLGLSLWAGLPPGRSPDPWQQGHAISQTAPRAQGNAEIRDAICNRIRVPHPAKHMAFSEGSFGKHLPPYGSFLSAGCFIHSKRVFSCRGSAMLAVQFTPCSGVD